MVPSALLLLVLWALHNRGSVKAVVMEAVSVEGPSPMDLRVGARSQVSANVEFTKDFFMVMIISLEGRLSLTRSLFQNVATGSLERVPEQLKSFGFSTLTWMGYTVGLANLLKEWKLSQGLKNSVSEIISVLPHAKLKRKNGGLEVVFDCNDLVQEAVHDATRLCYHLFLIWSLVIVASHRADDAEEEKKLIIHELLLHRRENIAQNSAAAALNDTKFDMFMELRSQIDEKLLQLVMKDLAERGKDEMLYHLGQMTEGRGLDNCLYAEKPEVDYKSGDQSSQHCKAMSFDGAWEIETKVPVLIMGVEGSSCKDSAGKLWCRFARSLLILPLLSTVASLNIKLHVSTSLERESILFTLGITRLYASFQGEIPNSDEGKNSMGPFFSEVSFSVVPVNDKMVIGVVTMTSPSPNTPVRNGASEQFHVKLGANIAAAAAGMCSVEVVEERRLEAEERPWTVEQLCVHGGKGGSYTFTLSSVHGVKFDRLKPVIAKRSFLPWRGNMLFNPVLKLPFASDRSVNFSTPDTFIWRFSKEFVNTTQEFKIEGTMYVTYINQHMEWETRMMPFKCKLEQELTP